MARYITVNETEKCVMARITRNRVIAFDIEEALQLQGETGPYLQYSLVRVAKA